VKKRKKMEGVESSSDTKNDIKKPKTSKQQWTFDNVVILLSIINTKANIWFFWLNIVIVYFNFQSTSH
jgi:hypothetical protein